MQIEPKELHRLETSVADETLADELEKVMATKEPTKARVEVVATRHSPDRGDLFEVVDIFRVTLEDPEAWETKVQY